MRVLLRIVLGLLILSAAVLAAGWAYQYVAERRDDRRHPPPGRLLPIDGRLMHLHCRGSGQPTVIVEQGIGGPSIDWNEINDRMGRITTVCDYDRAGMGHSEPAYRPTRSKDVATNLHALLAAARIDGDLVLVGWSAGGMYAREYYRQFPERVKGMVLVDSTHEQGVQRLPPAPSNQENLDNLKRQHHLARFGWLRLTGVIEKQYAQAPLPEPDRRRLLAFFHKTHTFRTLADEGVGLELDLALGVPPPKLDDIPLVVIAEGKPRNPYMKENLRQWHELQRELAGLSTRGRLVIATESAHFIHRTEPELIVAAVQEVVDSVRGRQP